MQYLKRNIDKYKWLNINAVECRQFHTNSNEFNVKQLKLDECQCWKMYAICCRLIQMKTCECRRLQMSSDESRWMETNVDEGVWRQMNAFKTKVCWSLSEGLSLYIKTVC